MTEPELVGRGLSSASRRRFIWLGGGIAAGLLLVPDFSFAAKMSNAVKRVSTGKDPKAAKGAVASHGNAARSAKSGSAPAKPASKAAKASGSGKSSSSRVASTTKRPANGHATASSGQRGKASHSAHGRTVTRARDADTTRTAAVDPSEFEEPSSFAPGRVLSYGDGSPESRAMSLYCIHTGEQLTVDYYVDGQYDSGAMEAIDHLLRDYHNDEICQIDPRVLNQLYDVRRALGSSEPFYVYSGYRSPETNESYRRLSGRVAEHSYHLTGQAIDVHLPGRDIRQIRNVAIAMRAGGVGYYPQEGFVHLDSGPIRRW
jgi:uncharacterized protein YcbK (DUF882 family)